MVLADSNVLLDIIKRDPQWLPWARATLTDALLHDQVFINPLIYTGYSLNFISGIT